MQARLGPQLENLAQELVTEIKPFLHQRPSVIRVHASHGFAVSKLRELLDHEPGIGVDLRYVSNQNSLVSLAQGACDLSGVHLPRGELRAQSVQACKEWLDPREHRVISFVTREMGLMVKRGNPLNIASLKDIVDARPASSTAIMIPARGCCSTSCWRCTGSTKPRSTARSRWNSPMPPWPPMWRAAWPMSASASRPRPGSSGSISSGFSPKTISSSAAARFLETEPMQRLLDVMKGREFHKAVAELPGYVTSNTGSVSTVQEFLDSVDAKPAVSRKRKR